jgi:hypothetical protein
VYVSRDSVKRFAVPNRGRNQPSGIGGTYLLLDLRGSGVIRAERSIIGSTLTSTSSSNHHQTWYIAAMSAQPSGSAGWTQLRQQARTLESQVCWR